MQSDLYEILEVNPRASKEVIRAAFNILIKKHPPSKKGYEKISQLLKDASDVLLDDNKREQYDNSRKNITGKVIGNYRVLEKIAEGGFGNTYKGEQILLGTPVCIKHGHYISTQDEQILMEEAKAIWDLRHWGIPTIRDIIKLGDGSPALIMSYVPGPTLEQIISKVGKLEPEHVAWIIERALNILKYLHYNGVVHGDVKPQNFIIQPEDHTVVLVDYGLSIIRPTKDSHSKGYTPYYASPEQIRGDPLIPESDFYSLGMSMIYALGGDIATKRVPKSTPDELCDFMKRMLVYDAISRPNWQKEDLCETIQLVRERAFGRRNTRLKPIAGL